MAFWTLLLLALQFLFVQSQSNVYRLPETIRPSSYVISIESDLENMVFNGTTRITLTSTINTTSFSLHSKDLHIETITLFVGGVSQIFTYNVNIAADLLTINKSVSIPANSNVVLNIQYKGTISSGNVGYYRAYYSDANNRRVSMAVTHLEATNARRAFPCFDQPNFKATFQINLVRRPHQVTSSNMALSSSSQIENQKILDSYEVSPKMSTYLVAFMVSEYGSISVMEDGKLYRTFARPELLLRGDATYSLQIGPAAIRKMEDFTKYQYPISKMDQVPVPNEYYKIGAMENWGMVTFRERMLMYNSQLSTAREKQSIATIITHEFAHQWFGNLVTPEWWNYIWLNEGFATYFEQYATSLIETSWDLMEQFITDNVQPAFDDDALEGSRAMTRNVETPTDIDDIYDTIVYEKAGSVIRMTENFLGSTVFQRGLQNYINSWRLDNVNPTKLYQSWQQALNNANLNVANVLHTWETQPGYPVVNVTRTYSTNLVTVTQERFYIDRETSADTTRWSIPLNYFTETTTVNTITWLNTAALNMTINLGVNSWVIFNNQRKGFYRVNYDEKNWELLTNFLQIGKFDVIPIENRAQLIDDAFNLARSRRLNYTIAMELGTYVTNETHYVPISTFNNVLSFLDKLSTGHEHHDELKEYGIKILGGIYNRFGFIIASSDNHLTKLTKTNVNTWLCSYGHKGCLEESRRYLTLWLSNTVIQPDMQSYVYCYGMRQANETQFNPMFTKYGESREDPEKARIATGLGCVENTTLLRRLLQSLIRNETFSRTDRLNAVTSVYTNNGVAGVNLILDFLTSNFTAINEDIGNTAKIIRGVASRITIEDQINRLRTFATEHNSTMTDALRNTVQLAMTTATNNLKWITQNKPDIILYLRGGSSTIFASILLILTCILIHTQ